MKTLEQTLIELRFLEIFQELNDNGLELEWISKKEIEEIEEIEEII